MNMEGSPKTVKFLFESTGFIIEYKYKYKSSSFFLKYMYLYNLMTWFKVAHHTWIKFLKSRRNSWMMKNKVTYDIYECTKSK